MKLFILAVLLVLAGCGNQPTRMTHNGKPCHTVDVWGLNTATDDGTLCW